MSDENKIKTEDILNFLGMPDVTNVDELKEKFTSEFFRKSAVPDDVKNNITGFAFKNINKSVKEISKNYGIELSNSEIESKKVEEVFSLVLESINNKNNEKISDLEKQISEPNEALKDWEKKYNKLENKNKDIEGLLSTTVNEFNSYKENASSQLKNYKINTGKKDLFSKIQFKSDMSDLERIGFDKYISDNYNLDLDENDEYIITDKKGALIRNEKVAGTFYKPEDILKEKAIELNLIATNPHAKNNTQPAQTQQKQTFQPQAPAQGTQREPRMRPFGM